MMSKKFHCPKNLKRPDKINELVDWYESKLVILERRQSHLSDKLSEVYRLIKNLKKEF